jgi:signal transduction histidine kinase/CheY-like chemotaxis protein
VLQPLFNKNITPEIIEIKRFNLYMKEMLPHFIGGIFTTSPFMYFIFKMQLSVDVTLVWFSLNAFFAISISVIYYYFYRNYEAFSFSTWKKLSYFPLVIYSLYVASAPWLLLQSNSSIYLYTMIVMAISLTGTTAYAVAYYLPKYLIFLTVPLLSLSIKVAVMDVEHIGVIYAVLLFLWISSFSFAQHINKSLINSIKLESDTIQSRIDAERANSEKSRFIAAASHDIRQPLQAINLFVSTLKSKNKNAEDDVLFERLEASVDGMSELLNSLLDVSKLDAEVVMPKPKHLALDELFKKIKNEYEYSANEKSINLTVDANHCIAFSDSILLERVLTNLLENAIRYTDYGHVKMIATAESKHISISIFDTGIGIPTEEQIAIFVEFHQLNNPERDRNKGLGLGLAIVKRLCVLQDWPLQLRSDSNHGSCFTIQIPLGEKELIKPIKSRNLAKNLQGVDVLIIEDEEDICFSLTQVLESWGCKVLAFESADEACDQIKLLPFWQPNLIISDYRLRNNKTGLEAIDQVQDALVEDAVALVISGDTAPERIKEIEASGLTMLYKPIKPGKLRAIIHHKMKYLFND